MKKKAMAWLLSAAVICSGVSMPATAAGLEETEVQTEGTEAVEEYEAESTEAYEQMETSVTEPVAEEIVEETETESVTVEESETVWETEAKKENSSEEEGPQEDIQRTARVQNGVLIPGSNSDYTISTEGEYINLTFTPSETGVYRIWSTGSADTVVELHRNGVKIAEDDDDDDGIFETENSNFCLQYQLEQNVNYTYRVKLYRGTGTFRVHFSKFENKEIQSITLIPWDEQASMVYPFDTEHYNIACSIDMKVTYSSGEIWDGTLTSSKDTYGNYFSYEIVEDERVKGKYEVSVYLNGSDRPAQSIEIIFPIPEQMNPTAWNIGEQSILISAEMKFYTFTPATNGSYGVLLSVSKDVELDVRYCDSDYDSYDDFNSDTFELSNLIAGQTYYIGIRGIGLDSDVSSTVKLTKLKEIKKAVPILSETGYLCGLDLYEDVLYNTRLQVTYMNGSTEMVNYDADQYRWITSEGGRLGYSFYDQYGDKCYIGDYIQAGRNTLVISDSYSDLGHVDFNAGKINHNDFATLIEQREEALNTGKRSYQAFWFTPKLTARYWDSNDNSCGFFTVGEDGVPQSTGNELIAGVKYLVKVWPDSGVSKVKITNGSVGQSFKETVTSGHDKNYHFTVPNSTLQLTFTPQKNYEYVIQSYGNVDTKVRLHEFGRSTILADNDDNGDDRNFSLSYQLKAGVTYIYTIQLFDDEDTGSFRVTLNGKPHNHTYTWITSIPASCAKVGKRHQECTQCGHTTGAVNIAATGKHTYGTYRITRESTAVAVGEKVRTCSGCGKKETAVIPKLKGFVKLNFSGTLPLKVKQSTTAIKVTMEKGDSIVSWKSSKSKVATVSKSGKITGKKTGTAKITVTLKSGVSKTFSVKVSKTAVKTKSLKLSTTKVTLKKGAKLKIMTTVTPITTKEKVKFKTSNKRVASITSKGIITAKKKGKATITVTCGKKVKRCKVTVK